VYGQGGPGVGLGCSRLGGAGGFGGMEGHLTTNRHGEWMAGDLASSQKRGVVGVSPGGAEVMGGGGCWGVSAVPPGMTKEEGDAYLSMTNQQGR